jgi:hypothetical protein
MRFQGPTAGGGKKMMAIQTTKGSNRDTHPLKSAILKSERGPTSFWVGGAISARLSAWLSARLSARLSAWTRQPRAYQTRIGHGRTTFFVRRGKYAATS